MFLEFRQYPSLISHSNTRYKNDIGSIWSLRFWVYAYYAAFTEEEKTFYEKVRDVEALDDEIVMLRVKIFALVVREPENMTLLLRSLMCLDRLCRTNVKDYKRDSFDLKKMKESTIALLKNMSLSTGLVEKKFH